MQLLRLLKVGLKTVQVGIIVITMANTLNRNGNKSTEVGSISTTTVMHYVTNGSRTKMVLGTGLKMVATWQLVGRKSVIYGITSVMTVE